MALSALYDDLAKVNSALRADWLVREYLPPGSRRDKIVYQEFNFQPLLGSLTEINKFLVSVWYVQKQ